MNKLSPALFAICLLLVIAPTVTSNIHQLFGLYDLRNCTVVSNDTGYYILRNTLTNNKINFSGWNGYAFTYFYEDTNESYVEIASSTILIDPGASISNWIVIVNTTGNAVQLRNNQGFTNIYNITGLFSLGGLIDFYTAEWTPYGLYTILGVLPPVSIYLKTKTVELPVFWLIMAAAAGVIFPPPMNAMSWFAAAAVMALLLYHFLWKDRE